MTGLEGQDGHWDGIPFGEMRCARQLRKISWQDVSSKFFCFKAGIYYWTETRDEHQWKYNEGKTLWIRYFVLMPIAVPFGSCARHWNNINIFGLPIPLNRPTDQAPWGFSMNFHEFPQPKPIILSDPTFLEGWIFFFRPQHNIPCSSCQAIFLRCLSEWLPEGEGRERMDSYPGQNLPRYLGLFIFCTFQVGVAQLKLFLIYSVFEGNDWW